MKIKKRAIALIVLMGIIVSIIPIRANAKERTGNVVVTKNNIIKENKSNTIAFSLKITNNSKSEIDLNKLKIKYWYDSPSTENDTFTIDWSSLNKEKIKGKMEKSEKALKGANSSISIEIPVNDKLVNQESQEIHLRISNIKNTDYIQNDNYSFTEGVTVYYDGNLIQGKEPADLEDNENGIKVTGRMYNKNREESTTSIYPWF